MCQESGYQLRDVHWQPTWLLIVPFMAPCLHCNACTLTTDPSKVVPPIYTARSTGNSFLLNITHTDMETAEQTCLDAGGHLAVYASSIEQREVEQFYITNVGGPAAAEPEHCLGLLLLPTTVCHLSHPQQ